MYIYNVHHIIYKTVFISWQNLWKSGERMAAQTAGLCVLTICVVLVWFQSNAQGCLAISAEEIWRTYTASHSTPHGIAWKLRGPCKHTAVRGPDRTSLPHMLRVESSYRRNKNEGDEARWALVHGQFSLDTRVTVLEICWEVILHLLWCRSAPL